MILFLDLEETVITNWSDAVLMNDNIKRIKDEMNCYKTRNVNIRLGLMSWAVWDDKDKECFNSFRSVLETELEHSFEDELIWSMNDWAEAMLVARGVHLTRQDMFEWMEVFGKVEVLFVLTRSHNTFTGQTVMLIDDIVEHDLQWHSNNNRSVCIIKNIKQLN